MMLTAYAITYNNFQLLTALFTIAFIAFGVTLSSFIAVAHLSTNQIIIKTNGYYKRYKSIASRVNKIVFLQVQNRNEVKINLMRFKVGLNFAIISLEYTYNSDSVNKLKILNQLKITVPYTSQIGG